MATCSTASFAVLQFWTHSLKSAHWCGKPVMPSQNVHTFPFLPQAALARKWSNGECPWIFFLLGCGVALQTHAMFRWLSLCTRSNGMALCSSQPLWRWIETKQQRQVAIVAPTRCHGGRIPPHQRDTDDAAPLVVPDLDLRDGVGIWVTMKSVKFATLTMGSKTYQAWSLLQNCQNQIFWKDNCPEHPVIGVVKVTCSDPKWKVHLSPSCLRGSKHLDDEVSFDEHHEESK